MEVLLKSDPGVEVDIETRRKKQRALLVQMVERRVRSRARQIYESRGQGDGQDLQDWFQAEAEILENNIIAPLYRRLRGSQSNDTSGESDLELLSVEPVCGSRF